MYFQSPTMLFYMYLLLLLLFLTHQTAHGAIGPDGLCSLFTFMPFTNNGKASVSFSGESNRSNPAVTMMASALMAMEHFNARNTSLRAVQ